MTGALIRRPSGLLQPFDPPELSIGEAIERGWHLERGASLLLPNPIEYLPTFPAPAGRAPTYL